MADLITSLKLFIVVFLVKGNNGEFIESTKVLMDGNLTFTQFDPGHLQYIVKTSDFLGLSKLTKTENNELQKICGTTNFGNLRLKISMGTRASPGQFPWVIALVKDTTAICTGTIISSRHIITASHCLSKYSSTKLPCKGAMVSNAEITISYGGICLWKDDAICSNGKDMKDAKVRKMMLPEHFNDKSCNGGGDIAIIELEDDLIFDDRTKPICVGYINPENDNGPVYNLGFGQDENRGRVPNLRFSRSIILTPNANLTPGNMRTLPRHLTSNGQNISQPGVCKGDSGGPVQMDIGHDPPRSYLHGIHSFGSMCGKNHTKENSNEERFNTCTNVIYFIEWICYQTGICRTWEDTSKVDGRTLKNM